MKRDFDNVDVSFDADPRRAKLAGYLVQSFIGEFVLTRYMNLLDFGCGTGLTSL